MVGGTLKEMEFICKKERGRMNMEGGKASLMHSVCRMRGPCSR